MPAIGSVVAHSIATLGANGVFLCDLFQASKEGVRQEFGALSMLLGYVNSPQAGRLDIYQGNFADFNLAQLAVGTPAAGASDAILFLDTFVHAGGVASPGTPVACARRAPFVICRYTNGGVIQTSFRLHVEALE